MTDTVVATIAGIAAAGVPGVHRLGGPLDGALERALDGVRDGVGRGLPQLLGATGDDDPEDDPRHGALEGKHADRGVSVLVGEREAAVTVELTVEFGASVDEVAAGVRREVSAAVERMTDLRVREVDVRVTDVHVPQQDRPTDLPEPGPRTNWTPSWNHRQNPETPNPGRGVPVTTRSSSDHLDVRRSDRAEENPQGLFGSSPGTRLVRSATAEVVGTFVLVLAGTATAIGAGRADAVYELVAVVLAFGIALAAMAATLGHVSGCHLNPAVTLSLAVTRKFPWRAVPAYVVAQLLGGVLGSLAAGASTRAAAGRSSPCPPPFRPRGSGRVRPSSSRPSSPSCWCSW